MEKNKPAIVYLTICKINGKGYVGVHKTTTPDIFDGYFGSGIYLNLAIEKYGIENFTRKTLLVGLQLYCYQMEKLLIKSYSTHVSTGLGYNLTWGGDRGPDHTGMKRSEETIKKMKVAQKGKIISEQAKQKIRIARAKQIPWNKGKVCPTISARLKGKPSGRKGIPNPRKGIKNGPNLKLRGRTSPKKGIKTGPNPKASAARKGYKWTPESIDKRQETRIKNGVTGKGVPKLAESIQKGLETKRRNGTNIPSPETIKKRAESNKHPRGTYKKK